MTKVNDYLKILKEKDDWETYLMKESGLPGPRGNLELAQAVAILGDRAFFQHLLTYHPEIAPTNSPEEFLAFCGTLGLGRLLAEGDRQNLVKLRELASDPRWRIREGVAMALHRWGGTDMGALIEEMKAWAQGNLLERRAAAAALCEPGLLGDTGQVEVVLDILNRITASLILEVKRDNPDFKTLRKGLAYCWSVAVVANPSAGKPTMEDWFNSPDRDVRWVMKENLGKKRLLRMDPDWVLYWQERI